jgi:hypothetical protein
MRREIAPYLWGIRTRSSEGAPGAAVDLAIEIAL